MTDQELEIVFRDTIKVDPRSWITRKAFADLLEEQDRIQEANEQRRWNDTIQDAYEWLEDFTTRINDYANERAIYADLDDNDEETGEAYLHPEDLYVVSVEELLERARDAFGGKDRKYDFQSWDIRDNGLCLPFNTPDFVMEKEAKFLECARIVLGLQEGKGKPVEWFFHCAC